MTCNKPPAISPAALMESNEMKINYRKPQEVTERPEREGEEYRVLKFSGLEVGQRIRAYDFEPLPHRKERYAEGVIAEVLTPDEMQRREMQPVAAYRVVVDVDTVFTENPRPEVFVPFECGMFEWDGRVVVIEHDRDSFAWWDEERRRVWKLNREGEQVGMIRIEHFEYETAVFVGDVSGRVVASWSPATGCGRVCFQEEGADDLARDLRNLVLNGVRA